MVWVDEMTQNKARQKGKDNSLNVLQLQVISSMKLVIVI